jgi:SAM-dependent methyltransferase
VSRTVPAAGSDRGADRFSSQRVAGFSRRADVYERGRPGYPSAVIDVLRRYGGLTAASLVLDLAAGTGKLTRQLARVSARCVAVEPSASMRAAFRKRVPGVPVVAGLAEAIPLGRGTCDVVTVAQAFHWFDAAQSLEEIARVLRPGGNLALVWNERDESVPWMAELGRLMRTVGDAPYWSGLEFLPVLARSAGLADVERESVSFEVPVDRRGLVDLVASRSYVNVLGGDDRTRFLDRVSRLAGTLPEPIVVPYRTEMLLARAVGAG